MLCFKHINNKWVQDTIILYYFQLKEVDNHMLNIFLIPVLMAVAGPPWCVGEAGETGVCLSPLFNSRPIPFG